MSQIVKKLDKLEISDRTYFLDANVWIFFLHHQYCINDPYGLDQANWNSGYAKFVSNLVEFEGARIGVNALLISEIVNSFLRHIAMRVNLMQNGWSNKEVQSANFKRDYRDNKHSNYDDMLGFIQNTLIDLNEADCLVFFELNFVENGDADFILDNFAKMNKVDFNDFCYYHTCTEKHWPMVSDDYDMGGFPDIEIYTLNNRLLNMFS